MIWSKKAPEVPAIAATYAACMWQHAELYICMPARKNPTKPRIRLRPSTVVAGRLLVRMVYASQQSQCIASHTYGAS
jgi:hypothetical protein